MEKSLTLLIFSRNDTDLVRELIIDMINYVSEIVIIDSSEETEHMTFKKWVETIDPVKIKIYYVVPLGYPDMLRPYALYKCSNEWIFMLDADERAPLFLKENLMKIIQSNLAEVYAIARYSVKKDRKISKVHTIQVRLFKKDFLIERGIPHELPKSSGRYVVLPKKYYIIHLQKENIERKSEYSKLDIIFSRRAYDDLPEKYKFKSILKNFIHLNKNFSENDELSQIDYFLFHLAREIYSSLKTKDLRRFLNSMKTSFQRTKRIAELKKLPKSKLYFEISREIYKTGLVKFLNFDDPNVVEKLTIQYKNSNLKGSDLLIYLIEKRYLELKNSKTG